jgi:hypothetical protein
VKQTEVTHLNHGLHLLLELLDVIIVRAGDDKVIDVDPDHQLCIIVLPNIDGVFQQSPPKA